MRRPVLSLLTLVFFAGGCPLPEMGGEGQQCFDPPDQCNVGLVCVGKTCVKPECTRDQDCPAGEFCNMEIFECEEDPDRPSGPGEPCPFGAQVHPDANECEVGMDCYGYQVDGSAGHCPSGDPYECWWIWFNPVCISNNCSGSYCTPPCEPGEVCPPELHRVYIGANQECHCIPQYNDCHPIEQSGCPGGRRCIPWFTGRLTKCVPIGTVPPGGACDLDTKLCQSGYWCIGNQETGYFCTELCDLENPVCPPTKYCETAGTYEKWGYCEDSM